MSEQQDPRSAQYERVRSGFKHLEFEDQARFLVEATARTVARSIEEAGRLVADELDQFFRRRPGHSAEEGPEAASEQDDASKKLNGADD